MKKIFTISFLFMFIFIATGIIFAQNSYTFKNANHSWMESPKVGEIYELCSTSNKKSAIKTVKVRIFKYNPEEYEWYGRFVFFDQNGKKLFAGTKKVDSPTTIAGTNFGNSYVVAIADIDKDGYTEVMIQEIQSDVRPQTFRVLKWKEGKLLRTKTGKLIKDSDGIFKWTKTDNDDVTWLSNIKEATDGKLYADFVGYDGQGYVNGLVEITPVDGGYKVVKTLKSNKM